MIPFIVAGVAAAVAGGVAGRLLSQGDRDKVDYLLQQSLDETGRIDIPKLERLLAQELPPSLLEKIRTDPKLREAQLHMLDKLSEMEESGGLLLEDRAAINDLTGRVARQESAGRGRIAEDMASRGQLDSGAQLAMSMNNQSNSANRAAQAGLTQAAQAQRRMFDSVLQRGEQAGRMRSQDFDEEARKAEAADSITRYNAAARERAAMANNANAQWTFNAEMAKQQARNNARAGVASNAQAGADNTQAIWSGIGQGAGQMIGGLGAGGGQKASSSFSTYGDGMQTPQVLAQKQKMRPWWEEDEDEDGNVRGL
jgi:hypothetical protein